MWIYRGYRYLGASYPHQGITNVGFAACVFKCLMVVPTRKTAVLEEPPIFSFNTSFLSLACRNHSAMLLGYPCSGGHGRRGTACGICLGCGCTLPSALREAACEKGPFFPTIYPSHKLTQGFHISGWEINMV